MNIPKTYSGFLDVAKKTFKTTLWGVGAVALTLGTYYGTSILSKHNQKITTQYEKSLVEEAEEFETVKLSEQSAYSTYYREGNAIDKKEDLEDRAKVAVIEMSGLVNVCDSSYGICSDTIIGLIDGAEDDEVDAYVFEINSGGGSPVASKEILRRIEKIDKPKIALIRSIGASAAYHIATGSDTIIAEHASWVGSIGVRMDHLRYNKLLKIIGIEYIDLAAGKDKTALSEFQELSDEHRAMFQEMLDMHHQDFIDDVYEGRKCEDNSPDETCVPSREYLETLATGRVFEAQQAIENGLIDQIGDRNEVRDLLLIELGEKFQIVVYEQEGSSSFGFGWNSQDAMYDIGKGLGDSLKESFEQNTEDVPRLR